MAEPHIQNLIKNSFEVVHETNNLEEVNSSPTMMKERMTSVSNRNLQYQGGFNIEQNDADGFIRVGQVSTKSLKFQGLLPNREEVPIGNSFDLLVEELNLETRIVMNDKIPIPERDSVNHSDSDIPDIYINNRPNRKMHLVSNLLSKYISQQY